MIPVLPEDGRKIVCPSSAVWIEMAISLPDFAVNLFTGHESNEQ